MKYYIDFDYTLFDTFKFREELYKILKQNNLDESFLKPTPEIAKSSGGKLLNLENLFKAISKEQNIPEENLLKPLRELMKRIDKYLYDDTLDFLKFLKDNGNEVNLLSWGDKEFQKEKVCNSGIEKYFDNIIYAEELKFTLSDIDYENSTFIDDSIIDLEGLYNRKAFKVIRIRRKNGKYSDKELTIPEIEEYTTLRELQEKIKN